MCEGIAIPHGSLYSPYVRTDHPVISFLKKLPLVKRFYKGLRAFCAKLINRPDIIPITNTMDMEKDWDQRAQVHARYYIKCDHFKTEAEFDESGLRDLHDLILPGLVMNAGTVALEIGCGIGRLLKPMAGLVGELHGVDVSGEMLTSARVRLQSYSNIRLHKTGGADLSMLPDHAVDFCYSYIVFQHIPHKDLVIAYITEVSRILKPGGIFRFQVDGRYADAGRRAKGGTWAGVVFSEEEMRSILKKTDLDIVACSGANTAYFWITATRRDKPNVPRSTIRMTSPIR